VTGPPGHLEAEMHRIAWAIKDAADASGWEFAREIPPAMIHGVHGPGDPSAARPVEGLP
jgi:hypothetical protein